MGGSAPPSGYSFIPLILLVAGFGTSLALVNARFRRSLPREPMDGTQPASAPFFCAPVTVYVRVTHDLCLSWSSQKLRGVVLELLGVPQKREPVGTLSSSLRSPI